MFGSSVVSCMCGLWIMNMLWDLSVAQSEFISKIVRDSSGDYFTTSSDDCINSGCDQNSRFATPVAVNSCRCHCHPSYPIFRDDRKDCVRDVFDCPLVAFIQPNLIERIPVVSLPVSSGQLVHPGAYLTLSGMTDVGNDSTRQLMCRSESSHLMTGKGWQKIVNVFELYEENTNRTFLQWFGNDSVRKILHQKLVLIRLTCGSTVGSVVYKPCISVRVGWVPGLRVSYHVLNSADSENSFVTTQDSDKPINSFNNNYSLIGVCLGLLGVMYVSALMIYLRNKNSHHIKPPNDSTNNSHTFESQSIINTNIESRINSAYCRETQPPNRANPSLNTRIHLNEEFVKKDSLALNRQSDDNQNKYQSIETIGVESTSDSSEEASDEKTRPILGRPVPRHVLKINPELFEPKHLLEPPPTAVELLQRIRELITIAKGRIKNFRFRPTLVVIPEDDYFYSEFTANRSSSDSSRLSTRIKLNKPLVNPEEYCSDNTNCVNFMDQSNDIEFKSLNLNINLDNNRETTEYESKSNILYNKKPININKDLTKQVNNDLQYRSCGSSTPMIPKLLINSRYPAIDISVKPEDIRPKTSVFSNRHNFIKTKSYSNGQHSRYYPKMSTKQMSPENEFNGQSSDQKPMLKYLKNSLGKLSANSKYKRSSVLTLNSVDNWTLRSSTSLSASPVQNNLTPIVAPTDSGAYCTDYTNNLNYFNDPKPSLESNENNESIISYDYCVYSDSEVSTTSSTIRDNNPLTSLESIIDDPSSPVNHLSSDDCAADDEEDDSNPIDECLRHLATTPIDANHTNHDRYYSRISGDSRRQLLPNNHIDSNR